MKRIKASILMAMAVALVVSACASSGGSDRRRAQKERNPAPCPNILVLQDVGRFVEFDGGETLEDVAFTGEITDVRTSCRYFADEPIQASVDVDFAFGQGPKAGSDVKNVTYFVAVTRTNRDVIAKQEFTIPVKFKRGRATVNISDSVKSMLIPRANKTISGINFEIVVGLTLTKEQVVYNRSGKSLKFPNL